MVAPTDALLQVCAAIPKPVFVLVSRLMEVSEFSILREIFL